MSTSYTDTGAVYGADLSDGVTFTSHSFEVNFGSIPQSVVDDAVNAYFTVINDYLPVTSSQKTTIASGNDGWEWTV